MGKFQKELLNSGVKDRPSTVKAGAWFSEAVTMAETHFCEKLLDRLTQATLLSFNLLTNEKNSMFVDCGRIHPPIFLITFGGTLNPLVPADVHQ